MSKIKLIVGLRNIGEKYARTRHNAGEWLMEKLAHQYGFSFQEEGKFFGDCGKRIIHGTEVRFLLPSTFMNLSGKAVGAMANFYRIAPEEILVVHDELDLPAGAVKLKQGGGHGGHNGLKDIIASLGNNKNFLRLRIGIGKPVERDQVVGYVLGVPSSAEQQAIDLAIDEAVSCVDLIFTQNLEKATNRLNSFKVK